MMTASLTLHETTNGDGNNHNDNGGLMQTSPITVSVGYLIAVGYSIPVTVPKHSVHSILYCIPSGGNTYAIHPPLMDLEERRPHGSTHLDLPTILFPR